MNTCLSVRCCSKFCGLNTETVENYINLFNKLMGELKDDIVRFPALEKQNLLMVNAKRFFPGAVGVVGTTSNFSFMCRHGFHPEDVIH